ncbi:hypothetical protein [Brevibacillus massiliensis]|uniref:hypothetical protein n=1 Tax=Brevibacillus massiliensis TaxID=1118054 RepID=UPI0003767F94|nr:hypothetical protein [Brevibacillus massiliensis]
MVELLDLCYEQTQSKLSLRLEPDDEDSYKIHVSLEYGNIGHPIRHTFIILRRDIEKIISSVPVTDHKTSRWIYTIEPSLTFFITPQGVLEQKKMFLFIVILDAGMANSSFSTETGPALAIRVTEDDLLDFAQQLSVEVASLL